MKVSSEVSGTPDFVLNFYKVVVFRRLVAAHGQPEYRRMSTS